MRTHVLFAGALAGVILASGPVAAQSSAPSSRVAGKPFQFTPYAGYIMFGNFIDGPLGTSLSRAAGPLYGAQLGMAIAPGVQLVGNVAYSDGDLKIGLPFVGGLTVGSTRALMYDGSVQLDIPMPKTNSLALAPFVQAGAGAIRWDIDLGNSTLQTKATNLAANLGAGVDLPLGPGMGIRFMAKDYIGKFDFKEAVGFSPSDKTMHNWALTAGLKLEF
jgi:hypothetical protein